MQTLRRFLVAGVLAGVLAGAPWSATAGQTPERGYRFTPPKDLVYNEALSSQLASDLAAARHYDGLKTTLGAEAYVSEQGYAFYIIWVHATEPATEVALTVRRTFDSLRQAPIDDTSNVQSAELVSWREDVQSKLAVGELEWRHISNETVTRVHVRMFVNAEREPRQLRGECVMSAPDADRLRSRCDAAIAALELTDSNRAELGAVPSSGTLRLSAAADSDPILLVVEAGIDAGASSPPSLRPPTQGAVVYEQPQRTKSKNENANTFLYVGGAILLIVGAYVLTRRSGDEQDRGSGDEEDTSD